MENVKLFFCALCAMAFSVSCVDADDGDDDGDGLRPYSAFDFSGPRAQQEAEVVSWMTEDGTCADTLCADPRGVCFPQCIDGVIYYPGTLYDAVPGGYPEEQRYHCDVELMRIFCLNGCRESEDGDVGLECY